MVCDRYSTTSSTTDYYIALKLLAMWLVGVFIQIIINRARVSNLADSTAGISKRFMAIALLMVTSVELSALYSVKVYSTVLITIGQSLATK